MAVPAALAPLAALACVLLLVLVAPARPPARVQADEAGPGSDLAAAGLLRLPASAQGPVSAALGAAAPAYRIDPVHGGLVARSPAQHLLAHFDRRGVLMRIGAAELGLSLRAVGYEGRLQAVAPASPLARANRVVYDRGGLSEWYRNGPLGLEQGFTVRRPAGAPGAAARLLTLSIDVSGNARPALAGGERGLVARRGRAAAIAYDGLRAWDAAGRPLHAWLELRGGRLLVHLATRGARYPLHIDPFVHEGEKLTAAGLAGPYGYVGQAVALSADGNTALVGAPADAEYTGSAWVFTRSGATWTQQAELIASGTAGRAWFGESVALSADGDTALIGAGNDDGAAGGAWVFARSGSTWTQQGEKLTGGGEVDDAHFGQNVSLSADGSTALVGGYNDDEHRGAGWIFTRSHSTWAQQGEKLTGGGEPGFFGWGVSLSGDGSTALIGEWGVNGGVGAAWVFTRSGSSWSKQGGALTALGEGGYPWFGYSLALSFDGNTAVIGAPHADGYAGAAWVYTRSKGTWSQQGAPLHGGEEVGEGELGYSAALSADGNTALLGGRVDEGFHGAAWAFERAGTSWAQDATKLAADSEAANHEEFGWSVALSANARTALVGSPCDKACIGSASVFVSPPAPPEFGRCVKVAAGTGGYANAGCTKTGGSGKYEWSPGVIATGFTTALASGAATIETVGAARITCSGQSGAGSYQGSKRLAGVSLLLTGCERAGEPCTSSGHPPGTIAAGPLEGALGVEKEGAEARKDKLALDLSAAEGAGALFEFTCGTTAAVVRGSVIVPLRANKMSATATLKYKAKKGKQKPQSFAGLPPDVLELALGGGPYEQAGLAMTATITSAEAVEANAAA